MKRISCLLTLLASSSIAYPAAPSADEHGAYLSAELGNGRIGGPDTGPHKLMRWRAFEARIGRDLIAARAGEPSLAGARIDVVYYNEGHPDNNHRDGFALQLVYARKLGNALTAEIGAGPYTSMNTTTIGGVQYDIARHGVLYSAALRFPLAGLDPGTHLRLGLNHVRMRDAFHSNALMLGIGRQFADVPHFPKGDLARNRLWLGASFGRSFTSHSGTRDTNSAIVQAKQYGGTWAVSFAGIFEGDDRTRVDRYGAAAQLWFVQPVTERWIASAGIGPYIAENRREGNRGFVHGLFSLQFERDLGAQTKVFFAFHRVKTYTQMNDRDLFHLGLLHTFGW
ncbi:hypothetical protein [Massilia horti]|uniref:Porin n=1 Tax=Massilia horti TaxID=2562153 RepID=A0A4Y9SYM2_9BURK|nr:hypothetical protein [Massilia horti]TFW30469.1 hypothetical protein E4O92_16250 [Massilia horti]TFW30612.1 hypothetical protein E4O92_17035 [Massilia horti]